MTRDSLPENVTQKVTYSEVVLPTPSADDPQGLRDAADFCRDEAKKRGGAGAQWWLYQASLYDRDALEADGRAVNYVVVNDDGAVHWPVAEPSVGHVTDKQKKTSVKHPANHDVRDLCSKLANNSKNLPLIEVARKFTKEVVGKDKRAQNLLRQAQRFRHLWRADN